jgi:hypothetical protein
LKPYNCITTLSKLSLILSWWKFVRMAMFSKQDHRRSRVAGSTCEISGLYSLLVRVVGYKIDENLNPRPGGAIRGKWRILDGRGESGLLSNLEL